MEEIRQFSRFGNGGIFAIFGFASLLRRGCHQANVKAGDPGGGQLIEVVPVARYDFCLSLFGPGFTSEVLKLGDQLE